MSNHSMVCMDGSEIGRAQYLQAQAAGVRPCGLHNPVLLKPASDRTSFIVLRGRPYGKLEAGQYATGRAVLADAAYASYAELADRCDVVVAEGAGSPAEINLRGGDYVNMGLARRFDLPVVIVGDIDRGGVLAALYGTWALLDDDDRALLSGYVINKFRGDASVLEPGLAEITKRTGMPSLGVLPYLEDVWIDSEDSLSVGRWRTDAAEAGLTVAALRFPRTSNATDVDALAAEPGVRVHVTTDADLCREADLLVLPGSRATVADLAWLRARGLAQVVLERFAAHRPILGICGGYQMLCASITDGVESADSADGLGIFPWTVRFGADKVLARPSGNYGGQQVCGYEIHHGIIDDDSSWPGGSHHHAVWGSIWHGTMENDGFRRAFLAEVAARTGSSWQVRPDAPGFGAQRQAMIDHLADAMEEHVDVDAVLALAGVG